MTIYYGSSIDCKNFDFFNAFKEYNDDDTIPENTDFEEGDTFADQEYDIDGAATIDERLGDNFSRLASKDSTMIMGRKKEALAWLVKFDRGKVIKKSRLKEGKTLIGRSSRSDIVIDNEEVSEEHARIIKEGEKYKLIDIGSLNGTYLNGKKLKSPRKIEDGDKIKFADIQFIFKKI